MISLSVGLRIDATRHPRDVPGGTAVVNGDLAPSPAVPPVLEGSGRIGAPLTMQSGSWSGNPVPELSYRWQRDGIDIPGAGGAIYTPVATDDGTLLACRVTAHNRAGSVTTTTPGRRAVWSAPEAGPLIADQFLNLDSGEHVLDVSSNFNGGALRFSVTGEGVSIDPETGILSIATETLRDGLTVTVTAVNSGGTVAQSFRVDVALPELMLPAAPGMLTAPGLADLAVIGTEITVEAGSWSGTPAPELSYQWLLDGVEIEGALAPSYLPLAEQDGAALTCQVTATNATGTAEAVSPAAVVRHATPQAAGGLADLLLDAGSGPVTVAAGAEFSGENLVFSVTGPGATIDSVTGLVAISTDELQSDEPITVTASNSGGDATSSFRITVRPVAPVLRDSPTLSGSGVIGAEVTVEPGLWDGVPAPAISFQWVCGGEAVSGAEEASYVPGPEEDGKALLCRVTATNAGGEANAETAALDLVLPAPVAAAPLADVTAEQGAPALEIDTAGAFVGAQLIFAVTGADATIDVVTGRLTLPTDVVRAAEEISVTASNSGGSVSSSFSVTIVAAKPELPADPPAPLTSGQWQILRSEPSPEIAAGSFRPVVALEPGLGVVAAQWTTSRETPPLPEHWETLAPTGAPDTFVTEMLNQGTGDWHVFTEAQKFRRDGGIRIRYRIAADGAWSEASTAKSIPLPEVTGPVLVPPLLLVGPALVGSAKVGAALTVQTGNWGGDPAPVITCQWLRDDTPIEGATGTDYVATAEDDLAEIACRVTATNAGGSAEAVTPALTVTHVAPVAKGELFEEILDEGTGPQEIPTAQDFVGEALVFAVEGAAAEIDVATGIVSIPTDIPADGASITVTASNSGGAAMSSFLVTIEAAEPEEPEGPEGPPAPLADDQWQILRSEPSPEIAAGSFRPVVAFEPSLGVVAAQWTSSDTTPPLPEHWETLAPTDVPETFVTEMLNQGTGNWHVFTEAQKFRRDGGIRLRYRISADGAWSEASGAKSVPLPETLNEPAKNEWARFFTSSVAAKANPEKYRFGKSGFQLQFCHGGDRSPANPNKAAMIMDVALAWVTENAEDDWPVWRHTESVGAENRFSASIRFDPEIEDRFVFVIGNGKVGGEGGGIYTTEDLGEKYTKRLALNRCPANGYDGYRNYRQVVNFAPSDYSRWYYFNAGDGFYRSTDRARTWSKVSSQPTSMGRCWYVQVDPNNADLIWAACDTGLWKSVNGGAVWNKAQANLPGGLLTSLNMNAENGDDFYVVVLGVGLYRTENGGGRFSKVQTLHDNICQVAVSPVNRNHIWVTGVDKLPSGAQVSGNSMYSSNGGARWITITHDSGTYGWDWPRWQDKFRATGNTTVSLQNVILPSPNTATRAIATNYCAMWRTNNGVHFENASDGYDNLASGEANLSNWGWSKTNPNVVYCAQFDYRLYLSRDNYDSFTSGNVVSGGTSDSHVMASVSVNPEDPDYLLMTNGYYTSPRTVLISKDGGRSASNSFRPSFFAANSGLGIQQYWAEWHPSIGRFAFAQSGMSSDWGTTWENWISRDRSGVFNASGPGSTAAAAGVIGVSPSNGSVLWAINASGNTLYRTTDMGRNWTAIVNGTGLTVWGNIPISFCPDPLDADACYWWDAGVGLKRWKAGRGVTVTAAELSSMRVDRIRVSPLDANHIYLMCREDGASMIYRSVTGPEGPWEDITGNLPRVISNRSIEIDPHTGIVFCVGTIGTRMFPPPGGHPRFNELAKRFGR